MAEDIYITEKDSEFFSIAIVQGWIVYNESDPLDYTSPYVEFNIFRLCRRLDCKLVKVRNVPYVELHFMGNNSTVMVVEVGGIHCRGGIVLYEGESIAEHFFGFTNEMLQTEDRRKGRRSPPRAPSGPTTWIYNGLSIRTCDGSGV